MVKKVKKSTNRQSTQAQTQKDNGVLSKDEDIPSGGFPPIYPCNEFDENTTREYVSHKSTVPIKDILAGRRIQKPII